MTTKVTAEQLSTARGCMLGLVLGDALGAANAEATATGTLQATSAGQLACFTVEGIIRGYVRGAHRGTNVNPPSVVWYSYTRWAAMQGISGIKRWEGTDLPDGWLSHVPALAARRGSAPGTVAALQTQKRGTSEEPAGSSTGAHGLTRSLPVGLLQWWHSNPGAFAAEVAATTHAGEAVHAADLGASIVAEIVSGRGIEDATAWALRQLLDPPRQPYGVLPHEPSVNAGHLQLRQPSVLAQVTPDARAMSVLAGGIYVALSYPGRDEIRDGLQFAASSRNGEHVGAVAGALLGAAHGADALPVDWVSRLELAWVADVLARDLMTQFADAPSGSEYTEGADPFWWDRYPGW